MHKRVATIAPISSKAVDTVLDSIGGLTRAHDSVKDVMKLLQLIVDKSFVLLEKLLIASQLTIESSASAIDSPCATEKTAELSRGINARETADQKTRRIHAL